MITDQARNLRLLAEHKGVIEKQSAPPSPVVRTFSLKSMALFVVGAVVIVLFLFFEYSNQRYMLDIMHERNKNMEERMLLLSLQLENLRNSVEANREYGFSGEKKAGLTRWEELKKQSFLSESEGTEDGLVGKQPQEGEEKRASLSNRLSIGGEKEPAFLGVVSSYEKDGVVIISCGRDTGIKEGGYVSVRRGEKRTSVLRVVEVKDKKTVCKVEELWEPIYEGDEVTRL